MDGLKQRLEGPVDALRWRLAGEVFEGAAVLEQAQLGLELEVASGRWAPVPRRVWHAWVSALAVRAVRGSIGPLAPAEHELSWLATALGLVGELGAKEADALERIVAQLPGGLLGLAATVNTAVMMMSLQSGAEAGVELARDAYLWAIRRHVLERCCEHAPCTLAERGARIAGVQAVSRGEDGEAAAEAERRQQLEDLRAFWLAEESER